jgi:kynurenine formamidase
MTAGKQIASLIFGHRLRFLGSQSPERLVKLIDLSHRIDPGMVTYKGLPGPIVCDFLSREASRPLYDGGAEFAIQRVDMVGNTGTYLDSPFHRYADGMDLERLPLDRLAHLDAVVIDATGGHAVERAAFDGLDVTGRAVLVRTGWDRHWRTEAYFDNHPFLTAEAAEHLARAGAALVGIDSHNIDDTRRRDRPVHTILLGRGIPICEHMTGLGQLPAQGARFYAVPPRMAGVGTFPVRAFAMAPAAPESAR